MAPDCTNARPPCWSTGTWPNRLMARKAGVRCVPAPEADVAERELGAAQRQHQRHLVGELRMRRAVEDEALGHRGFADARPQHLVGVLAEARRGPPHAARRVRHLHRHAERAERAGHRVLGLRPPCRAPGSAGRSAPRRSAAPDRPGCRASRSIASQSADGRARSFVLQQRHQRVVVASRGRRCGGSADRPVSSGAPTSAHSASKNFCCERADGDVAVRRREAPGRASCRDAPGRCAAGASPVAK